MRPSDECGNTVEFEKQCEGTQNQKIQNRMNTFAFFTSLLLFVNTTVVKSADHFEAFLS